MNSSEAAQNPTFSTSPHHVTSLPEPSGNLTDKLRQKVKAAGEHVQSSRPKEVSTSDLESLNPHSQELILRVVDKIKTEDSQHVINTLDESRNMLRGSFEEFKREQDECRRQLEEISKTKARRERSKENAISLSTLMRKKHNTRGFTDINQDSNINPTYQAYFDVLLSSAENDSQHSTDKAAVVKYIRRRERQRRAEYIKKTHELSNDILEKQTAEIIEKMEDVDIKLEHERQRQNEILRARMDEKKMKTNNVIQANEIIDRANEAELARQRVAQTQREKIQARLSAARSQQSRNPTNMIHVQSNSNEKDNEKLNEEQIETTKKSLQLLTHNDEHPQIHTATPVYGNGNTDNKIATIEI